jgi:hypothetical protein
MYVSALRTQLRSGHLGTATECNELLLPMASPYLASATARMT